MIARVFGSSLKTSVALALCLVFAACAGVLGIEERELDKADTYPPEGYAGCSAEAGCGGCLEVHRAECETRAACGTASGLGECAACVCGGCTDSLVECRSDEGCAQIWQCLEQTRCDLSEGTAGSCANTCGSVVAAHGGVAGESFQAAVAVRACAIANSCYSCLPATPEPPESCRRANGCEDCDTCMQECLCGDGDFFQCRTACGETELPENCAPGNCGGCLTCVDICSCAGGEFDACTLQCQPTCTLATGCGDCGDDCIAECLCQGNDQAECEATCGPPPPPDLCVEANSSGQSGSGLAQCGGCSSCLAKCTCAGTALEACMSECEMLSCCSQGGCDSSPTTSCVCEPGTSADECARNYYGSCDNVENSCDVCPCDNCPGKYALCEETFGCMAIFECMRSSACVGGACAERCAAQGQEAPEAFGVAEALWACTHAAACTCSNEQNPDPVTKACGTTTCNNYVGTNGTFDACCPDDVTTQAEGAAGAAPAPGEEGACGLSIARHYPELNCLPLNQPNAFANLTCPDARITGAVYNGVTLQGCCRAAENVCGYLDNIVGLGCVHPASFFGDVPLQNCGLLGL
jgi:hypothetical protein